MHILRLIARLNVGGPARHVTILNEGLAARGHHTLLVHGVVDEGEAEFAHVPSGRARVLRSPHLGRRIGAVQDLRAFLQVLRLLWREQPDVVHTHTAKAGAIGRVAAAVYNATRPGARRALVVHTFHGHVLEGYFGPAGNAAVRAAERLLARLTDRIVAISPSQQSDLTARFRIAAPARVSVVPLGLDLAPLLALAGVDRGLRDAVAAAPEDVVVGWAGRMVPIKDLSLLLEGVSRARAAGHPLRLALAGDGPARAALESEAAARGLGGHVHFLGWVEDLPRFYAGVDVVALSSRNEGTPVSIIEAMAAARAVVATAVGGVPDVIEADGTGLLVPYRDAVAFGRALGRLARDAELRARLGASARASAATRFTATALLDTLERLYAEGLDQRRTR